MTVLPWRSDHERGTPYETRLLWFGEAPVPQLGARVYELVADARRGIAVEDLAMLYRLDEHEVFLLCGHHGVGPRRAARYYGPRRREWWNELSEAK